MNGGVDEWMIDCSLFGLFENSMSFIRIMWSINRAVVSRSKYYTEKELASHSLQNGEKIETLLQSDLIKKNVKDVFFLIHVFASPSQVPEISI